MALNPTLHHQRQARQAGQAVTEAVLLLVLGVLLMNALISGLKKSSWVESMTSAPMQSLQTMVECGVWFSTTEKPCGIAGPATGLHPTNRVVSFKWANEFVTDTSY